MTRSRTNAEMEKFKLTRELKIYSNQLDSEIKNYFEQFETLDLKTNFSNFFLMGGS